MKNQSSQGIISGGKEVATSTTTNGKHDLDTLVLASSDVVAQTSAPVTARITVTSKVEQWVLVIAKCG